MFLNEAALGKEHYIDRNDISLTAAPKGKDCVVAKGQQEPGVFSLQGESSSIFLKTVICLWF